MKSFPQTETTFLLQGPAGNLEVLATPIAENTTQKSAIAIICHPHPLHGGTMTNKVVTTLARAFRDIGLRTVRFNFRGVGKSEGSYAEGIGETDDLLAVVKWVKEVFPDTDIWLAGFSFGSCVAIRAATMIPVAQLVCIAPPVSRFDLAGLPPVTCPWLIIQGDQDEVVVPEEVFAWAENLNPPPTLIRMQGAGHFFHGRLLELRDILEVALA